MKNLTAQQIFTIKDAARKLTGEKRREFQARVALDYLKGSSRKAENTFGWRRTSVELGLNELRSGIKCFSDYAARGNRKTEEKMPQLKQDIHDLVDPKTQVDPKFQGKFKYTRMTAKATRQALIDEKGWKDEELPCENTIGNILNRLNFRLRRVQKRKPVKKIPETNKIFEKVYTENKKSDGKDDSLRISIDSKAKVDVGEFSRRGKFRGTEAPQALDHDMQPKKKLVPFGILDVVAGPLSIFMGTSIESSDFIVDCLQLWWSENEDRYSNIRELVINLDNGPANASNRTQFMKRMVEFADKNGLEIVLVYYPPYHSKYNPIERCWGILEIHWNGSLLDSVQTIVEWTSTMTWKGNHPTVHLIDKIYEKGVKITKESFKNIEERLNRNEHLPKYHLRILPNGT